MTEDVPIYWRHQTSSVLHAAVAAYLTAKMMSDAEIIAMRAYLRQWIFSPAWDIPFSNGHHRDALAGLRNRIGTLIDRAAIEHWLDDAAEIEIDPL
jgi:hypothetical protein